MKKESSLWLAIALLTLALFALSVVRAAALPTCNCIVYADVPMTENLDKDIETASLLCLEDLADQKYDKARFIGFLINFQEGILRVFFEGIVEKEARHDGVLRNRPG